jgi:cytochrome P450
MTDLATGSPAELSSARRRAPGPRFRTPLGALSAMRGNPLQFLLECWKRYGDTVEISFPPWRLILVVHPDDVRRVLHDNHRNYWKGAVIGKLKRIAGEGLVFSDGDLWRRQRQLIQPAFHRDRIAALADMMAETTSAALERLAARSADGRPVDIAAEMSELTLEIVAKALFGAELGEDKDSFAQSVTGAMVYANHLMNHIFILPLFVPTAANRRGRRAIAGVDRVVWKVIEQRRRDGRERHDLLGMLLGARDAETNQAMDDKQLRDEVVTFLVAGHETTAVTLSWAWYLLSRHPAAEERLREEVSRVLQGRAPGMADLPQLQYTRMVIEESMRLYPPAWAMNRETYRDDEIAGMHIPARSSVLVSPFITHRHPLFWEEPETFDPSRFSAERSAGRPEYAYFPFGGGPRGCVGRQFAMMEAQIVLAMTAQRLRLRAVPGQESAADPILTLRPRGGVPMTVEAH